MPTPRIRARLPFARQPGYSTTEERKPNCCTAAISRACYDMVDYIFYLILDIALRLYVVRHIVE